MLEVTCAQLFQFFDCEGPESDQAYPDFASFARMVAECEYEPLVDEATFLALRGCQLRRLVCDVCDHEAESADADDLIGLVEGVLRAQRDGLTVVTWRGEEGERLAVAYDPGDLEVAIDVIDLSGDDTNLQKHGF